jgi:formylglycine-generating enzyme required for sulfatase activity
MTKLACLLVWLFICFTSALPSHAQSRRVGLVIGIDGYAHLTPLTKAVGDARAVAAVLRDDLQFTKVITGENLDRRAMAQKLGELDASIQPGDTVFLFFAGHGVALGSENVLLPADMPKPGHGADGIVRDEGFPVDAIVQRVQRRGAKVTMLVLDACRNNPFEQAGVRSIGQARGLARIDAPQGVFVLFSAGLGQMALDRLPGADASTTSVFTRHLVPALKTPGLSHVQIAKRVQQEVDAMARDKANHAQQPAYYDQIVGEIVLKAGPRVPDAVVSDDAALVAKLRVENEKLRQQQVTAAAAAPIPVPAVRPTACDGVTVAGQCIKPGSGRTFRDCPTCPEMVIAPAGSFTTGSPTTEPDRNKNEKQRVIEFSQPLGVAKFAVTLGEFNVFLQENGKENIDLQCNLPWFARLFGGDANEAKKSMRNPGFPQTAQSPVVCIDWHATGLYAQYLSKKTGHNYRLLTSEEREYVTRAGSTTIFSMGKRIDISMANYTGTGTSYAAKGKSNGTVSVVSFKPNMWGLHNVHGNIREWTSSCERKQVSDPNQAHESCKTRGGSWARDPSALRSAAFSDEIITERSVDLGFRVARTL